jgi:hypothetical protein
MKIIGLEEHFVSQDVLAGRHALDAHWQDPGLQHHERGLIGGTSGRPDRFQGFATLATPVPQAAATEIRRAVTQLSLNGAMLFGRTRDRNLDHPDNWPIFETAAALRAPLHIHPQSPVPTVRDAIGGFGDDVDAALSTFGLGWH